MISTVVMAIVFKFAVGECVLDPGKNKYLIMAHNHLADAYVLKSMVRPDVVGMVKREIVENDGKKVICE